MSVVERFEVVGIEKYKAQRLALLPCMLDGLLGELEKLVAPAHAGQDVDVNLFTQLAFLRELRERLGPRRLGARCAWRWPRSPSTR